MAGIRELVQSLGPNAVYIVFMAGLWMAVTAVYVPGTGIPEVTALVGLALAGVGLVALPTNPIGVILMVAGLACFLALIYYRHDWQLILSGAVLQVIGSVFLFRAGWGVSPLAIVLANAAALAYHQVVLLPGLRIQDQAARNKDATLIGQHAEVVSKIAPTGTVRIRGEMWSARADAPLESGQWARVVAREGLQLLVVPSERPASWTGDDGHESAPDAAPQDSGETRTELRSMNILLLGIVLGGTLLAMATGGPLGLLAQVGGPVMLIAVGVAWLARPDRSGVAHPG